MAIRIKSERADAMAKELAAMTGQTQVAAIAQALQESLAQVQRAKTKSKRRPECNDDDKIVLEHYPASRLPEDLRVGIDAATSVKITVESEARRRPMTREEFLISLGEARANATGVTMEEAVARVRELRDEWED